METMKFVCTLIWLFSATNNFTEARSLSWYLKGKDTGEVKNLFKRKTIERELSCPMFLGFYQAENDVKKTKSCGPDYFTCSGDEECGPGLKCCYNGCIFFCTIGVKPKEIQAIDWIKEPRPQRISGDSWLDLDDSAPVQPRIDCSNSNFSGVMPLRCPTGYKCITEAPEEKENGLPGRGQCVRFRDLKSENIHNEQDWIAVKQKRLKKDCRYKNSRYTHSQYFFEGCNFCFCDSGVINCQLLPCPDYGMEKSPTDYKEHDKPVPQIVFKP